MDKGVGPLANYPFFFLASGLVIEYYPKKNVFLLFFSLVFLIPQRNPKIQLCRFQRDVLLGFIILLRFYEVFL